MIYLSHIICIWFILMKRIQWVFSCNYWILIFIDNGLLCRSLNLISSIRRKCTMWPDASIKTEWLKLINNTHPTFMFRKLLWISTKVFQSQSHVALISVIIFCRRNLKSLMAYSFKIWYAVIFLDIIFIGFIKILLCIIH